MKKKMQTEMEAVNEWAEKIRDGYTYMDNMPLEGWIWEFVRRSSQYRQQFALLANFVTNQNNKEVKKKEDHKGNTWDSKRADDAIEIIDVLDGFPKCMYRFLFENQQEPSNKELFLTLGYPFDEKTCLFIPRPGMPYRFFGTDLNCSFKGTSPIIVRDYEFFKSRIAKWVNEINSIDTSDVPLLKEWYSETIHSISWEFALNHPEETIYIGIPRRAKKKELLKEFKAVIDKYTEKPKIKQRDSDKWKYYFIVYDLRAENPEMSFSKISSLIQQAYPYITMKKGITIEGSEYFETRNCINFYENALSLIEGDYQKYLL